jgi:hypothetical protein
MGDAARDAEALDSMRLAAIRLVRLVCIQASERSSAQNPIDMKTPGLEHAAAQPSAAIFPAGCPSPC